MSKLTRNLDKSFYPNHQDQWDNIQFRQTILGFLQEDMEVLDYGAGRGNLKEMNFFGEVKFIAGVDPDKAVTTNPNLNEAMVLDLSTGIIPYEDNRFDIVFSDNVLEHVQDPETVFNEVHRVLKPGGLFLSKTPNKYHYVPLFATLTPHSFHEYFNKKRGRSEVDTFPTVYKCNTKSDVEKYAAMSGFDVISIERNEGRPEYLRMTAPTYLAGIAYERLVNSFKIFENFRVIIIFSLRKK